MIMNLPRATVSKKSPGSSSKVPVIELIGVRKVYPGKVEVEALRDINLKVYKGERIAILGKSGSGKSTLLNLLGLLDVPTGGQIFIRGKKQSHLSDKEAGMFRRYYVGFVFQFFNLLPTLTLRDNLLLPLELAGERDHSFFFSLLEKTGLADKLDRYPEELSGGEQQRAAIIRALIKKPSVVLADEPTGNLDSQTGHTIVRLMNEICHDFAITLIMATHSREAASICQKTLRLHDGHLIPSNHSDNKG